MKKISIFSVLFVLIDQIVKFFVRSKMILGSSITVISGFFQLTYVENSGAAFSLFQGYRYVFIVISLIILFLIIWSLRNKHLNTFNSIIYSLIISGIIGNLIDRVFHGSVIDFLDFRLFNYNMAVFNLADTFIVVGCILLLIMSILGKDEE